MVNREGCDCTHAAQDGKDVDVLDRDGGLGLEKVVKRLSRAPVWEGLMHPIDVVKVMLEKNNAVISADESMEQLIRRRRGSSMLDHCIIEIGRWSRCTDRKVGGLDPRWTAW